MQFHGATREIKYEKWNDLTDLLFLILTSVLAAPKHQSLITFLPHAHVHMSSTFFSPHHWMERTHSQLAPIEKNVYIICAHLLQTLQHPLILTQSGFLNPPLINLYLLPALRTFKLWRTINLAHTSQKLFQGMLKQYSKQFSKVDYKFHIQVLLHITIT